jgi:hypothetical protein
MGQADAVRHGDERCYKLDLLTAVHVTLVVWSESTNEHLCAASNARQYSLPPRTLKSTVQERLQTQGAVP